MFIVIYTIGCINGLVAILLCTFANQMIKKSNNSSNLVFYPCKIHSVKSISENFTQVLFYSNSPVWEDYLPGQYIILNYEDKLIKCWIATHHFGADLPSVIIPKNIFPDFKNGDELLLSKAEGNFKLNPISNFKRSFIFLAQDEGIIPIFVMLQSLLYVENMSKAAVYVISKNNEALFFNEIDFLKNMVHGRIRCELEINKKTFSTTKLNGLFEFLSKEHSPLFYVCGKKSFINKVADFMLNKKIPISNLQFFKTPLN